MLTKEQKNEFNTMLKQLTPENKRKVKIKCLQLLNEQEGHEVKQNEYYYFFDCLDAGLSEKYLTAQEIGAIIGEQGPITEKHIKTIAAYYEATLYRYEFNEENNPINEVCLYDPFGM